VGFPLPGTWKLLTRDRKWQELEGRRPAGEVTVTQARRWHHEGPPRDITTAELRELMARERPVLVDARPRDAYDAGHLPGALPWSEATDEAHLLAALGDDRTRTVVTYCSGYG
jgi:3-mercaptopyruvate sulfurtransferase SseA